jgi:DNA-binding NarL/FixJ family response regulator
MARLISPAEARVLALLQQGLTNKSIAAELVLSPRTVECHISHLLAKTGCRSRTQLLLWSLHETAVVAAW